MAEKRFSFGRAALIALLLAVCTSGLARSEEDEGTKQAPLPDAIMWRDVAYGENAKQRIDIYAPKSAKNAPVIMMVHGGAWVEGDKASLDITQNKVTYWVPRGFVFVSVNYRLLPEADPIKQAEDVASALAFVQKNAKAWGGDGTKIVLMGHSSGGHLAALLAADPSFTAKAGAKKWAGTIVLDTGALNVPTLMNAQHYDYFDPAFGKDPAFWAAASPYDRLQKGTSPILLVCSKQRKESCPQAYDFYKHAQPLRVSVGVIEEDLAHLDINEKLGLPGVYTESVDRFIRSVLRMPKDK